MALIICSECGKEFSEFSKACPNCGCPTEIILNKYEEIENEEKSRYEQDILEKKNRKFKSRENDFDYNSYTISTKINKLVIKNDSLFGKFEKEIMAKDIDYITVGMGSINIYSNGITDSFDFIDLAPFGNDKIIRYFRDIAEEINVDFSEEKASFSIEKKASPILKFKTISKTQIIDSDSRKSATSAIARGAVGGILLGPIGLLGAASAKNKKTTTFLVFYSDDSRKTFTVKNNSFQYKEFIRYLEW